VELVQAPSHRDTLAALYTALDQLENRQQIELARALNIQIGFNANDGD
jgi:predicted lipoprotein